LYELLSNNNVAGSGGENRRFKIGKPWISCLADNKKIWKEQAVRGMLLQLNEIILVVILELNIFSKKFLT